MEKAIFWAVCALVFVPIFLGLMSDELSGGIFAVVWGLLVWRFFLHTKRGRKMYRKGYEIASQIMTAADA